MPKRTIILLVLLIVVAGIGVASIFWPAGKRDKEIAVKEEKAEPAVTKRMPSARDMAIKSGEDYPGVYGTDSDYRVDALLPFEREVYNALMREFEANPEPDPAGFKSGEEWARARDAQEAECVKKVAKQFNLDEKTTIAIWNKVDHLR